MQLSHSVLTVALTSALAASPSAQQRPPRGEAFAIDALLERLGPDHRWLPFLDRSSLSCGIYRLPKGASDGQSPHARDEVYYVVSGRAELEIAGKAHDANAGAVLFVAAGVQHRFLEIEEDLTALVFFSETRPTRGGMAAGPRPTEQTPYDEASERGNARIFYWFGPDSAGQFSIDYGRPVWRDAYDAFLTKPSGRRWRFGENFWTSLDTNIPLTIGGVELGVGQHYLVLQNHAEHGLRMIALDPQYVRKNKLDAYEANETEGGTAIPLRHRPTQSTAKRLDIQLAVDREEEHRARLAIRFGKHLLEADVTMHPE